MINSINIVREKGVTMALLAIVTLLCVYSAFTIDYKLTLVLGLLPFLSILLFLTIHKPLGAVLFLFILNYGIMGIGRYITLPIPVTNIYDLTFFIFFAAVLLRQTVKHENLGIRFNLYLLFLLLWCLYCIVNLGNSITGDIRLVPWIRTIRVFALYSLFTCIAVSITCKRYTCIRYILILWGVLTLIAVAKGYWQRNYGFDHAEWMWLMTRGGSTHLINSGVRYFSFFTDAANFGCSMGLSSVVYLIATLYTPNKYLKLFFLIVGLAGGYGLLISGTRAAMAIPVAGLGLFVILAKKWKLIVLSSILLIGGVGILKYTTIGESNRLISRMRTAFNLEDPSFQARLNNQKALRTYMAEAPFGIGVGVNSAGILSPQNKFYFASTCPPDSDLVNIWVQTGKIGLSFYLILQFLIYLTGSYILLFRIRNPEIRGPLTAMLCGCAGMLVASYGNNISFMFPNGPIIYTCLTLVFLGPYFDKQYSAEHGTTT